MQDERVIVLDRHQLGQVRLRVSDVDVRIAVVAEDAEPSVEVQVDRRGLEVLLIVRLDDDLAGLERRADVAIGQDAHRPESSHAATLPAWTTGARSLTGPRASTGTSLLRAAQ